MAVGTAALHIVVILVVAFRRIKCLGGQNFGGHIKTLSGQKTNKRLGKVSLCVILVENCTAVLRTQIGALTVGLGGVVGFKKGAKNSFGSGPLWIELHQTGFVMPRSFAADLLVAGVFNMASGVANRGGEHSIDALKEVLRSPKATRGENKGFVSGLGRRGRQ